MNLLSNDNRIGYIYKISGYGLTYYGSTIQLLNDRKYSHISDYRSWIKNNKEGHKCYSFEILELGDDWDIECLETYLTDINKTGLKEREQYWIDNNECVNKIRAIMTEEQRREYQRKWAENKRRENGIAIKEKIKTANEKEYKKLKQREYRAKKTEEDKKEELEERRQKYAQKEQTDAQKEAAKERARKQREEIKANPEKVEQMKEYKRLKAREYREKKKAQESNDNK